MTSGKFDVIITGAGPAGCATAIALANSGLKIALLEKSQFPRDKTCGDALSVDVVNQLAMLSPELAENFSKITEKVPSHGVRIYAPNHRFVDIPFIHRGQKKCGYICKRFDFDLLLFRHLKQYANVKILENCQVNDVSSTTNKLELTTTKGDFTGQIVVGADGAQSVIARKLAGLNQFKKHHSAGIRVYYEGVQPIHPENYIELYFFHKILPGYLWIFPLPDDHANVGIGMLSSEISGKKINLKNVLQELLSSEPQLKERFKAAKPLETPRGFGLPLGSKKRKISGNRFLLTGDAAGLIDPFSGEGIANAIRSGRIAADHIQKCFEQHIFSAPFNQAYDKAVYQKMWKEFQISYSLQRLCRYTRLFNFVVNKANQNPRIHQYLTDGLADVEVKQILTKPGFYLNLLFNK